ncbi:MAG TPA: flagellar hook-associated protein FlgL [Candidatus Hydrogenedentes bacterium]|nr:flagellar hook-associated protein FlgL [Candidatus Hydrogenedentota bacterium]HOK88537.1 flagellar hook-associated protein FlgL [Candidatus Hydrogenedentota bacterium]HOV60518.1 flagellar hook-associated protein FlgL [Candidatus Hydrogenedentota bacterium]
MAIVSRTTQNMLTRRALININRSERRVLSLQEQLATGQRVNRPSDDPLAARRAIDAQAEVRKNTQYLANITTARPYLQETETSLLTTTNILQRAYELTLQGANDTNSQVDRNQIAIEINQILENALVEANHKTGNRYIFGGTWTSSPPYTPIRNAAGEMISVIYNGNDETIETEISPVVRVPVNETGNGYFWDTDFASANVFETLISIRDNLRAGNTGALTQDLRNLKSNIDRVTTALARVGAIQNRMDLIQNATEIYNVQLESLRSESADADFAEVTVNLNVAINALQGALNVGARVLQPTLLDFIR